MVDKGGSNITIHHPRSTGLEGGNGDTTHRVAAVGA